VGKSYVEAARLKLASGTASTIDLDDGLELMDETLGIMCRELD
jgi:hypothetical protein